MRGYFGIGIYNGKTIENIGTLWRSAYQLGASFIFTISHRWKKQSSDTVKTYRHIPLFQFEDFDSFIKSRLYDCQIICIEFNNKSTPIQLFNHPERCIYLLGAEDNGLPNDIIKNYKCIEIPTIRTQSYNVAIAGSIVMYDRLIKISP